MESAHSQASYTSCLICLERFQKPKVLPCGHTFCLKCIQKMVETSFNQCPKCEDKFSLPSSGNASDFPTNFDLLNAIEDREAKNTTSREDLSQFERLKSKDHCILHDTPYEVYCKSCSRQACTKCLLDYHKPNTHIIITRNDFIKEEMAELEDMMRTLRSLKLREGVLNEKLTKAFNSCRGELKEIEDKILETLEDKIQKLRAAAQNLVKQMLDKFNIQLEILNQLHARQKLLSKNLQQMRGTCLSMKASLANNDLTHPTKLDEVKQSVRELSNEVDTLSQSFITMPTKLNMKFLPQSEKATTSVGTLVHSGSQTYSQCFWQKTHILAAHLLFLFILVIQIFLLFLLGKGDVSLVPMFANISSSNYIIGCVFSAKSTREGEGGFKPLVHMHRLGEAFYK